MENFHVEQDQPNFWIGLLIAFILGLVGSVVWATVYFFGYLAWLVAFLMVYVMAWGYKKFNLVMDKKGYICIAIFAFFEIALALILAFIFVAMSTDMSFGEALKETFMYLFTNLSFIINAVLSVIAIVVACIIHNHIEKDREKKITEKTVIDVNPIETKTEEENNGKEIKDDANISDNKNDNKDIKQ